MHDMQPTWVRSDDRAAAIGAPTLVVVRPGPHVLESRQQQRFAHLMREGDNSLREQIQAQVDADWRALLERCTTASEA
jgi:hypothetical protein